MTHFAFLLLLLRLVPSRVGNRQGCLYGRAILRVTSPGYSRGQGTFARVSIEAYLTKEPWTNTEGVWKAFFFSFSSSFTSSSGEEREKKKSLQKMMDRELMMEGEWRQQDQKTVSGIFHSGVITHGTERESRTNQTVRSFSRALFTANVIKQISQLISVSVFNDLFQVHSPITQTRDTNKKFSSETHETG